MALHQIFLLLELAWVIGASVAAPLALPDCEDHCGNISIPYPFGTREGCYIAPEFLVTCNHSYDPPKLYYGSEINVTDIYLSGQLRILSFVAKDCYNEKGLRESYNDPWIWLAKFPVSNTRNKFVAIGCDTYAVIRGSLGQKYTTGCLSLCGRIDDVINGSCSGIGCCQTTIPKEVRSCNISLDSYDNHTSIWHFNPCSYAFIVEEASYNFSSTDFKSFQYIPEVPVVLDWAIGDQPCNKAKTNLTSYACKDHSDCHDFDNGPGYQCLCSKGYEGNPYLENGCQDIDECRISNPCNMTCHNIPGGYSCSCPEGYGGDGRINGTGCSPISVPDKKFPLTIIALGISSGLTVTLVIIALIHVGVQKRNITKVRENFFRTNGGRVLQQLLSASENSVQKAKIFSEEELKKATNNFNKKFIVGEGGFGIVYKGTLADNEIVAIKKSKLVDPNQIEQFVTEVKILSQINHPNVVKLYGCCLETPVPLLVYEFITNNTLYHHLHDEGRMSSIPWELRLRIAVETADALAYMHSTTQIIHRDIKSANILLNDDYTAKVSDFGISKLVASGKTHLTTLVQGTYGYIDPEYFDSGNLTEKSDVYSFGVILVELLTGQPVVSSERTEKNKSLARYFMSSLEEDSFFHIVEDRVKREGNAKQLESVAEIAKKCLKLKGEKRPTMEQVKHELEALRKFEGNTFVDIGLEEREPLLGEPLSHYDNIASTGLDSMRNIVAFDVDSNGR